MFTECGASHKHAFIGLSLPGSGVDGSFPTL